jgi:hypothetical protein
MLQCFLGLVLVTNPWISGLGTLGPPTQRQIGQLVQAGIIIDRMMKSTR